MIELNSMSSEHHINTCSLQYYGRDTSQFKCFFSILNGVLGFFFFFLLINGILGVWITVLCVHFICLLFAKIPMLDTCDVVCCVCVYLFL